MTNRLIPMHQRGAWWKGITATGVEVAVSDAYFKTIQAAHTRTYRDYPSAGARAQATYGMMACLHPQWWVEVYRDATPGCAAYTPWDQPTWVRRKGYAKLMLGDVTTHGYGSNEVGTTATLVFRVLSAKRLQGWMDYYGMFDDMREHVETYFREEHGVTVRWER